MGIIYNNGRNNGTILSRLDDIEGHLKGFTDFQINARCWNESLKRRVNNIERELHPPRPGVLDEGGD